MLNNGLDIEFPQRKPQRLLGYDYSTPCFYFVTICVDQFLMHLGEVKKSKMNLNEYGNIVRDAWLKIPDHYDVLLNAFIVMPNHVHGIVRLKDYVGTGHALSAKPGNHINLSTVIGSFKAAASRKINLRNEIFFRWQRSFYDHIIMSESELNSIIKYINNNPWNWEIDQKRIDNLLI